MTQSSRAPNPLEREVAAFEQEKPHLLKEHMGKFALFKGDAFIDSFSTFELAYQKGVQLFGTESFLVRQVVEEEPIEKIPALTLGLLRGHP